MIDRKKVLVVDDDPVQLVMTRAWLESAGYTVITHDTPFGTSAIVRRERPGIIVMDLQMPGLDGESLVELLKTVPGMDDARVIFHSGKDRASLDALARNHIVLGAIAKTPRGDHFLAEFNRLAPRQDR